MYKKIAVLLDGSKLAETALPHLEEIAKNCSTPEILLVSITESIKGRLSRSPAAEVGAPGNYGPSGTTIGSVSRGLILSAQAVETADVSVNLGKMARTAQYYLARISAQLETKGLKSRINVLVGDPAEEIVRFVNDEEVDLIILANRGKSGFSRWDLGNVAQKVLRTVNVPVLLLKPQPSFKETKSRRKGTAT